MISRIAEQGLNTRRHGGRCLPAGR